MNVTATPAPKSTVLLDIEVPSERLDRAVRDATGRLSRRTRVAGFRPGKAPRPILERVLGPGAVLEEAVDQLVQAAYREAIIGQGIIPLANADVEIVEAVEGQALHFKATVQVRPEVTLGDYANFNFTPEIEAVDDEKVAKVIEELRDQNATLAAVEERGARNGDWAVIGFRGTKDGVPFDGGTSERMPLIIGEDRLIPGFEANLIGVKAGESTAFDITFPEDYPEAELAGKEARFEVDLRELREKIVPPEDDDFAQSMGDYPDLAALRVDIAGRLGRSALDKARHEFSDRIIEYAVANATLELPDILVDQEVEVMHDEFRSTLARQGIAEPAYLKATNQTEQDLHAEFRPRAEQRTKVLLVLSKIAEAEGLEVTEADVEEQVEIARARYEDAKTIRYFESERGRNFIRSTLRRTRLVESLVDRWLAAHPDHPALPHMEDDAPSALDTPQAAASASIDATDPGAIPRSLHEGEAHDHGDAAAEGSAAGA
jgi:trigger factor